MSALKTRRAHDHTIPVSITTPEEKKPGTSQSDIQRFLNQARFSVTLPELGGLVIRANTKEQLIESIAEARHGAKKQGMYPCRKKEKKADPVVNFEACRVRAVERVRKRKNATGDKPKASCPVGAKFGEWTTLTDTFYDRPNLLGAKRWAMVKVQCKCGTVETRALSVLKRAKTRECADCAVDRRKEYYRSRAKK